MDRPGGLSYLTTILTSLSGTVITFHHLFAVEEGLDLLVQGARFEFFLRRAEGGVDAAAELAVHLDHDFGFVFLGEFGVEGRPGLAEDGAFAPSSSQISWAR